MLPMWIITTFTLAQHAGSGLHVCVCVYMFVLDSLHSVHSSRFFQARWIILSSFQCSEFLELSVLLVFAKERMGHQSSRRCTGQPSLFDSVNSNKTELKWAGPNQASMVCTAGQQGSVQHGLAHFCSVNVVYDPSLLVQSVHCCRAHVLSFT